MSYVSTYQAHLIDNLPAGPKAVLTTLATFERNGQAWPSVATIAKRASMGIRTVQRHLAALINLGYITRTYRAGHAAVTRLFIGQTPPPTPAKLAPPPLPNWHPESGISESVNQIQAVPATEATETASPVVCSDQSIKQPDTAQPPEWAVSESRDEMLLNAAVQAVETALGRIDTPSIATIEAQQSLQTAPGSSETSPPIPTPYLEVSEAPTQATEKAPTAVEVEAPAPTAEPDLLADVPAQVLADLAEVRKAKKKAPKPTKTEVQHWYSEALKAGWSIKNLITLMVLRGWSSFGNASWLENISQHTIASPAPAAPKVWTPDPNHIPASGESLAAVKARIAKMKERWAASELAAPPMRQ